jgi:antitoxin MazE
MKTEIIRIGNSQGVRLPKTVLHQCGLQGAVELEVEGNRIVIHTTSRPRTGWAAAFGKSHKKQDDKHLASFRTPANEWDDAEWRW